MKRIVIIYPHLTSYILPVLQGMAESGRATIDVVHGPLLPGMGFGDHRPFEHPNLRWIEVDVIHLFGNNVGMFQRGVLRYIYRTRPDVILIWANPRYLSFWGVLIEGRLLGVPVYTRGHGLFKKHTIGFLHRLIYKAILSLSCKYVCYTPAVKESLMPFTKNDEKLTVDFNTIYNDFPISPDRRNGVEPGIFYIGRVRPGCGVELLIESVNRLNLEESLNIELHIVGDGPLGLFIRQEAENFSWLHYYGAIYNQKSINKIAQNCRFGCVPGFMGLNVVHMMSLSLPIITHGRLEQHMGPEPEYIHDKKNGWLLKQEIGVRPLKKALRELWLMPPEKIKAMQENAFETYKRLNNPPFHERLLRILGI